MLPEVAPMWDSYMTKNNQNLSKQKKVTVSKSVNLEVTPLIVKMTIYLLKGNFMSNSNMVRN